MFSYLDVKKVFGEVVGVDEPESIDEDSDIVFKVPVRHDYEISDIQLSIENEKLKTAYDSMISQISDNMILYNKNKYEVAIVLGWYGSGNLEEVGDTENSIKYCLGDASLEYLLMICSNLCEEKIIKEDYIKTLRYYRNLSYFPGISGIGYVNRLFRLKTISISSDKELKLSSFSQYCSSFEYVFMYKTRYSIMKMHNISDIYERGIGGRPRTRKIEEPPRRSVNEDTLEHYAMAVGSDDPFTAYISFYHVLEFYFDEVYKKKLVMEMKDKITDPSFSYKNDNKLYSLAKWVGDKMKNDDRDGRGNELASLKYVLEEYVQIPKLIAALDEWTSELKNYYRTNNVSFTGSTKDKIAWTDTEGVYTNLSNRIYNTRNALVHSKSGKVEQQYKPQKHKLDLKKELPLIQSIAEIIIFQNGEAL